MPSPEDQYKINHVPTPEDFAAADEVERNHSFEDAMSAEDRNKFLRSMGVVPTREIVELPIAQPTPPVRHEVVHEPYDEPDFERNKRGEDLKKLQAEARQIIRESEQGQPPDQP